MLRKNLFDFRRPGPNPGVRGLHDVRVGRALVLVVLGHRPDCGEQLPCPLPGVRVRRDVRRRAEPLEGLLERRSLLFLGQACIDLRDRLLEPVHPEGELLALGQELRMLLARPGKTRPPMPPALPKTSRTRRPAFGRSRSGSTATTCSSAPEHQGLFRAWRFAPRWRWMLSGSD